MRDRSDAVPDRLRDRLDAAGCRCTKQRRAVYDFVLRSAPYHPTAEDVFRGVKDRVPRISLATVYKALEALESSNLVMRLPAMGGGSARFDAHCEPHYHLRCERSGRVDDVAAAFDPDLLSKVDPEIAAGLLARGFHITGYRLELLGYYNDEPAPNGHGH